MPVDDLLADHHYLHWSTQLDHFITVRAGGTPYGMFKQALRELDKRERGLNGLYADRDRLIVDIEELELRIHNAKAQCVATDASTLGISAQDFNGRRAEIDLRQKRFALSVCERSIRDHERERDRFIEQAIHLRQVLGIDANCPLTPERRTALDRDMWVFLLKRDAALELLTHGAIEKNTLCFVMSLPPADRDPILTMIRDQVQYVRNNGRMEQGPLIEWYFATAPLLLPGEPSCELLPSPAPSPNSLLTEQQP